jgi:tripartite-type tricarboxylate transporter receptor subunit TctC
VTIRKGNHMHTVKWAAAIACLAVIQGASAQSYPSKPIKLVNPYAAGGPFDLVGREVAKPLAETLGQQIIIENRPGGGATLGAAYVAKTEPDGYTLLLSGSPSHIIVPAMMSPPPYDGIKDFTAIAMIATVPNLIVVKPSLPVNSFQSLIAYAKANPGKLSYGSPGNGSIGHLATEMLKQMAGIFMVHIPYKGAAPAVADLLGGQIDLAMLNISAVMPHIKSGKMRPIAMATRKRAELLPDLPTIDESGFRGYDAGTWYGVFGPAGLPRPVTNTVYQALAKVMSSPQMKARLQAQQGAEVTVMSPDELLKHLQREHKELVGIIKSIGLKAE